MNVIENRIHDLIRERNEADIEVELIRLKKIFMKWFLLSFIPIVNWITTGIAYYCYVQYVYLKKRGREHNIYTFYFLILNILSIYSLIIFPIISYKTCENNDKIALKIFK